MNHTITLSLLISCSTLSTVCATKVDEAFRSHSEPSHISQHLPQIKKIAAECSSAMVIGIEGGSTSVALLAGLRENPVVSKRSFIGIDSSYNTENAQWIKDIAQEINAEFTLHSEDSMKLSISKLAPVDVLMIDEVHSYCRVLWQLRNYSHLAQKYIILHDTSAPFGYKNDATDKAVYPSNYDTTKEGVLPAIQDFLKENKAFKIHMRFFNSHGLVILKRTEIK